MYDFAEKSGFADAFYFLPPDEEFTFADATHWDSSELPTDLHPVKLFLGANEKYEIWAYLKLLPRSNTGVVFLKEYVSTRTKTQVDIEDVSKVILMFPFHVFLKHETEVSQKQLVVFIQYLFLDNSGGNFDAVWGTGTSSTSSSVIWIAFTTLRRAMNHLVEVRDA